jgi:hypothetical protein
MPIDFPNDTSNPYTEAGKTWVYDGTAWNLITLTATIPDGAISTSQISNSAVTAAKLAATAAIQPTLVNAKGDLIVATANDTVDRVAVGTDGYALLANSSATAGVSWGQAGNAAESDQAVLGIQIFR